MHSTRWSVGSRTFGRFGWVVALSLFVLTLGLGLPNAQAQTASDYTWRNVAIGGGGYTTQVYVHPQNADLVYVGTDVGGMYRYDATSGRLKQLISRPPEEDNLYGCAGIALHPTDQNIVYYGGGKYSGGVQKLFKSTNKGDSWTLIDVPSDSTSSASWNVNSGDVNYRFGKRIVLNPANSSQLFVGFSNKGLYRRDFDSATASTGSWTRITSIPNSGAVNAIVFDPSNSNNVYVAMFNGGVYRSTNNGQSFSQIGTSTWNTLDMAVSKDGDNLFIATDGQGLRRLDNPTTGTSWVTPTGVDSTGEYRAVEASPNDNGLILTAPKGFGYLNQIRYSTNAGDSFSTKTNTVTRSIPWHPTGWPGSAISHFAFAKTDDNKVYFTDWYSVYRTDNIRATSVAWKNDRGLGHEEVVSLSLKAMPTNTNGVLLLSGHADVSSFAHTSLNSVPSAAMSGTGASNLVEGTGLDYAPSNPNVAVVLGSNDWGGTNGYAYKSTDAGKNWTAISGYGTGLSFGKVAFSNDDANNFVVATKSGVKYTTNGGSSFSDASGAPTASDLGISGDIFSGSSWRDILVGDRGQASAFFLYNKANGQLYRSTNDGANWSSVGTMTSSTSNLLGIAAAPGRANHIWAALAGGGLWRYNGSSTSKISAFSEAKMVAIGATKSGATYPTIYVYGKLTSDSSSWIYRSTDEGANWTRINGDNSRIGDSPQNMTADPSVYGRVYVGTNGTSVWVGEVSSSTTPTSTPTSAPSGSTTYTAQMESGSVGNGTTVGTSQSGYTGSGYIDLGSSGSWGEVSITPTAGGTYSLSFRYANGDSVNRSASISVNGTNVGTLSFVPTGGWTTWNTASINATLNGGSANTIRVTVNSASGGANIDKLDATGP